MKHIAFDIGAESGRAIVGEIVCDKLRMQEIHRFATPTLQLDGSLRWDIDRLFDQIKTGLDNYAKLFGEEPCTMGVDTWGVDYGILDPGGKLCTVPFHYRNRRNEGTSKIIDEKLGQKLLYRLTGIQQMEINTLNQLLAAQRDDDGTLRAGNRLLFIGDLLHYRLCGSTKSEYSIATTSGLFSTRSDRWSGEVLDAFGLDGGMLPQVVPAGSLLGQVRPELAKQTGISPSCLVIAPTVHDTASAVAAIPSCAATTAFISSGTWSLVGLELDDAIVNRKAEAHNIANYGGAFRKKLFLRNVMGLWLIQQARLQWQKVEPSLSYDEIVARAERAKPFLCLVDPNDPAFLNPVNMLEEICGFCARSGQPAPDPNDVGQVARMIFESLALAYRQMFHLLADASGLDCGHIHMIGGGIRNTLLTQFTANATRADVIAGPVEATAAGNLLMQAYGSHEIASQSELRQLAVNTFETTLYRPKDTLAWDEAYERYCAVDQS